MSDNNSNTDFSVLRKRAEEKLRSIEKKSGSNSPAELEHELNVHKEELEMQNEELLVTQRDLVRSIDNYTELFNLAPVGYFILDSEGIISNVNRKGSQLLGLHKNQLIGNPFSVFLNGESFQDDYYRHRNTVMETGELRQLPSEVRKKDGTTLSILIESICVNDEQGQFKHLLSTFSDITRRVQEERKIEFALEKEVELSELKSRFITMVSHEFRTPLTTILSSIELIDKYDKTEDLAKRKNHVGKIKSSVKGLKEILSLFFTLNEIENNMVSNQPATFDMVKLTDNVISMLDKKGHTFFYNHSDNLQDVFLDAKLLKICLANILGNAVKYSPSPGAIEITTEKTKEGTILIFVKDYGIGIPEHEKAQIFEKFYKAQNADVIQGTGLGLNTTQKLISLMGGSISFESKLNEGTVFVLEFKEN